MTTKPNEADNNFGNNVENKEESYTKEVTVDGHKVSVDIVGDQPIIESDQIPKDVDKDKFLIDVQRELVNTFKKSQQVLGEKNKRESEIEALRKELEDLKRGSTKHKPESEHQHDSKDIYSSKFRADVTNQMKKILGVKTKAEVDALAGDQEYEDARLEALAYANNEMLKSQSALFNEQVSSLKKRQEISGLLSVVDINASPEDVIGFAKALGIDHMPAKEIVDFYKFKKIKPNLANQYNKVSELQLKAPKLVHKTDTSSGNYDFENLTLEELHSWKDSDPRWDEFKKWQKLQKE